MLRYHITPEPRRASSMLSLRSKNNPIRMKEVEDIDLKAELVPVILRSKTPLRRFIDRNKLLRELSCFWCRKENAERALKSYCSATVITADRILRLSPTPQSQSRP